jgi:hypothetical protein
MNTATITLTVDAELAEQFEKASPEQQRKTQLMIELLLLRQLSVSDGRTLSAVMDDISRKAEERGLTEDTLSELLSADEEHLPLTDEEVAALMEVEPMTGAEIVAAGLTGGWEDLGITDGAEWVNAQKRKRRAKNDPTVE